MNKREITKPCLFYPEDSVKMNWDMFMTFILLFACLETPYKIAFISDDDVIWNTIDLTADFLFLIDIIIIFNTAYQDEAFQVIDERKLIAINYLKGWFLIDFFAIVPFQAIFGGSNMNEVVRFTKIGRMYKMVKLTKLLRLMKIIKNKSAIM